MTMLSGKKAVDDDNDVTLIKMKLLAKLVLTTLVRNTAIELDVFPWLRFFGHKKYEETLELCRLRDELWNDMWQEGQKTYSSHGEATCVIHAMAQLLDKQSVDYDPDVDEVNAKATFSTSLSPV